jgi:hypothetical protein
MDEMQPLSFNCEGEVLKGPLEQRPPDLKLLGGEFFDKNIILRTMRD